MPREWGKRTRFEDSNVGAPSHGQHGGDEVAETVDTEAHGLFPRTAEERRSQMRDVVLDGVQPRAGLAVAKSRCRCVAQAARSAPGCAPGSPRAARLRGCRSARTALRRKWARGLRATAIASTDASSPPAISSRHQPSAATGKPAQCLTRWNRSSSTAATRAPSARAAAEASAWYAEKPRIRVMAGYPSAPRSGRPIEGVLANGCRRSA